MGMKAPIVWAAPGGATTSRSDSMVCCRRGRRSRTARAFLAVRQKGRAGRLAGTLVCRGGGAGAARVRQSAVCSAHPRRAGADRQRRRRQKRLAAAGRGGLARPGPAGRPAAGCQHRRAARDGGGAAHRRPRRRTAACPCVRQPAAASGELFHACLDTSPAGTPRDLPALAMLLGVAAGSPDRGGCPHLLAQAHLARFFVPALYRRAHSELALLDADGGCTAARPRGGIRRCVWLIDYKTGDDSRMLADAKMAERHRPQLAAIVPCWRPVSGRPVHTAVLLADGRLIQVET